ncbi:MAG TPA: TIGR04282 family arsenosugar biosynthesis glycosyltransferase [Candidatus Brocadiaceae bacterium]
MILYAFRVLVVKMDNALIIFLKYPEPGKVKTRLAKAIGNERACAIYKSMAEDVIKNVSLKNPRTYDVYTFFTPSDKENEIKDWLMPVRNNDQEFDTQYIPQEGDTLGKRMSHAFQQLFQDKGYKRCIIIGTDCLEIDTTLIENAFEALQQENDIVIGPCNDGGYYLLGMSRRAPLRFEQEFVLDLFVDIDWSTDQVFDQTMKKVRKNNLSYSILKTLADIDTPEDLYRYALEFP